MDWYRKLWMAEGRGVLALAFCLLLGRAGWADPEKHSEYERRMHLQESAMSGDAESMHELGNYYLLNNDRDLAISWFKRAADQDFIPALWRLGNIPKMEWTKEDYLLSKYAYEQLIRLQKYEAFSLLGDLYADKKSPFHDYEKAVLQYMDGVKQRDIKAIMKLARYYLGQQGHRPNYLLALPLLKDGVAMMNPEAMRLLGMCERYGLGLKVDTKKGWSLIFKAAQFGDHQSMVDIAEALYEGKELQKNHKLSKLYFQRAVDQGYSQVAERMKELKFDDEVK